MACMLPFGLEEGAGFHVEMMNRNADLSQRKPWRVRIGAYPDLMRSGIQSQLLNRFADLAFHGLCSAR
jgi:hypothetical protein